MTVKTQLCLCNIQGVGVCTNVISFTCKRDLVPPPDFNDNFALLCISSDLYVQPEDGLTGKGRNMYLAETFVHTPTPCILHKHSCVLTVILYEFV